MAHKRYADAESVLRKAAKFNQVDIPEDPFETKRRSISNVSNISASSSAKYTLIDMFRTPKLRKRSIILFYIWWASLIKLSLIHSSSYNRAIQLLLSLEFSVLFWHFAAR